MILHKLNDYYHRLQNEGIAEIAVTGFQKQPIPFIIVLDRQGRFLELTDTRIGEGKKKAARLFNVPKGVKKTSGIAANLLWDSPAYIFARPKPDPKKDDKTLIKRAVQQKKCFVDTILKQLPSVIMDAGVAAVLHFLEKGGSEQVFKHPLWPEIEESGAYLSFKLEEDNCLVCERPAVLSALTNDSSSHDDNPSRQTCLITGELDTPARLHTAIKGVLNSQTSGANIVSFNLPAFTSYGKDQSLNAPVGKKAEFSYTTALNHLLAKGSRQKLQVGDATTVFWAERQHGFENIFADLFGEPPKGEPEQDYKKLIATFQAPKSGVLPEFEPETDFFILGLSPNAARIAVRYWYAGSVRSVADNMWRHFDDLEMVKGSKEWRTITLRSLLRSTALLEQDANVPPNIAGDTMRAVLIGTPYPKSLLSAAVRRCRAERQLTYPRAALIKAILVREARFYNKKGKEVGMSLDVSNANNGYLLGRLFATLEKIQEEASPGINATIRDRFYAAASATPVAAFPHLLKLKNHHLGKIESKARIVFFEKIIGEIMAGLNNFSAHLTLADQGRFAVGYYHQRQAFFTSSKNDKTGEGETNND